MKKLIILMATVFGMNMVASAYSTSAVFLQHKGNITTFEPDSIQLAFEAAVDGDTILLNEGTFPGFEISKQITVRGVGLKTIIQGSIQIAIPETPELTATLLESLYLQYADIIVSEPLVGLKISKCTFRNFTSYCNINNCIIERCHIYEVFNVYPNYNVYVTNSKIKGLNGVTTSGTGFGYNTTFTNCNIMLIGTNSLYAFFAGTCVNSILSWGGELNNCTLTNCLLNSRSIAAGSSCIASNLYNEMFQNEFLVRNDTQECVYDTETLISKGYLGNDGTVVGIYGGTTPFTLEPAVPKVTNSLMQLDTENKKLNVTLTVSPQ